MVCIKCKRRKGEIRLGHLPGEVCSQCFAEIIEKRVRKDVRLSGFFRDRGRVVLLDDGSANSAVCCYFADKLFGHSQAEFVRKKIRKIRGESSFPDLDKIRLQLKADRIILPWNASQESERILFGMTSKKQDKRFFEEDKRTVKLLGHVLMEEVEFFAKIKGLKAGRKLEHYDTAMCGFLSALEKDSPDIRFALINSFEEIAGDCKTK